MYETPSMNLLDKQSLKIPGVKDFSWSPRQNIISYPVPIIALLPSPLALSSLMQYTYMVPERDSGNTPAKVVLVEIPSRKELRQKNIFNVNDVCFGREWWI